MVGTSARIPNRKNVMKRSLPLLLAGVACVATGVARAQEAEPLREAESSNRRFHVRIRPGRPGLDAIRGCKATLLERSADEKRARPRWERFLVNETGPAIVVIRDDGRFVVTLDEFNRGGARHAVVIYGAHGELLRHFLLPDLLRHDDWKQVKLQGRSVDWLSEARFAFADRPAQFVIEWKSGRQVRIDLRTLSVVRDDRQRALGEGGNVPPEILAAILGDALEPEATKVATRPSSDAPPTTTQAAPAAHSQPAPPVNAATEAPTRSGDAQHPERPVEGPTPVETDEGALEPMPPPAEPATVGPLKVPLPNPAHPVDYVAWANEQVRTDDPNGGPAYEAAMSRLVPWSGDEALYLAAEKGDPAALASTELQAWLFTNREAIGRFRDAAQLEFKGWPMSSADGSLIGALLPNLSPMRQLAKLTILEGQWHEAEGRGDAATANYVDVLAAGARVRSGPTLIENLVGVAVESLAARALLDLPSRPAAANIDYVALATQLEMAPRPLRTLDEAVQFERASSLDSLQRMYTVDPATGQYALNAEVAREYLDMTGPAPSPEERHQALQQLARGSFEQHVREVNQFYDAMTRAAALPYPARKQAVQEVEAAVHERPDSDPFLRIFAPSLGRVHFVNTRGESARRAATLVTNLMAYRQVHGAFPEALDEFGDLEFARDPFIEGYFRYRRVGDDFVLYSAGGNGADDGGTHDARGEQNDIVYWPRPAQP